MQDYVNYINGTWKKASIATVPINDSGFLLGDGLFETIRFDNKTLFKPEKHLERLYLGLQIIHICLESSDAKILEIGEGTSEVQRMIISKEILKSFQSV